MKVTLPLLLFLVKLKAACLLLYISSVRPVTKVLYYIVFESLQTEQQQQHCQLIIGKSK